MIALALALGLAASAGPDDTDLPRSLSVDETPFLAPDPIQKDEFQIWVGAHLGVMGAYDASDPSFAFGGGARFKFLSWLGAEGTVDFGTRESFEHNQIHVVQIPVELAALLYPPVELPVRPYGIVGIGWTFSNVSYTGAFGGLNDTTEAKPLFFLGFGAEFELQDNIMLDANMRFVFASSPPHFAGNSADWIQFTVGILIKLSK
jgi:opacity protein-like surface antigen